MIKSFDLRIGNLIYLSEPDSDRKNIVRVEEILKDGTLSTQIISGNCPKYCFADPHGIPLTEEWLVKFGFEKLLLCDNCFQLGNPPFDFKVELLPKENYILFFKGATQGHAPCKYVHQLQNLYFALIGTKLEIK